MPKKGNRKRLKFRADICSETVTVADFADADPATVKSGRLKKGAANAFEKEVKLLCRLETSECPVQVDLSSASDLSSSVNSSSEELDSVKEDGENVRKHKKKINKTLTENGESGSDYPLDIWHVLAAYIRPEDVCTFALICRSAWAVTCTAAFWTRLYKRHCSLNTDLPFCLQPDSLFRMRFLRARVIRALFHFYEPFSLRVSRSPALPDLRKDALLNSQCLLFWVNKVSGTRSEPMWEFNFKFKKQPTKVKNGCARSLVLPNRYEDVNMNPDSDCYLLRVTTLNFIFTSVVMGMTLSLFTINVSRDMWHHRVCLEFQDSPIIGGKKLRREQGVPVILDPVHSVSLMGWWHPQFPVPSYTSSNI